MTRIPLNHKSTLKMSKSPEPGRHEELPAEIKQVLEAVVARIRRVWWMRGWAAVGTVVVAGLLLAVGLDWATGGLATAVRWPLLLVVLAAGWVTFHLMVWKPLRRELPLLRVAGWLESHHPELDERLSTAVGMPERGKGVSSVLLDALVAAAVRDVKTLDPDHEVNRSSVRRWVRPLAVLAGVWLVLFMISPGTMARLLARTINPFSQLGNAGALRLLVTPGDMEVIEGEEVRITIEATGRVPEVLTLRIEPEDRVAVEETLRRGADGKFSYFLAQGERSFRYQVRDGRDVSDSFRVKVWPTPVVSEARLRFDFPEYTGMEAFQVEVAGAVEVLAHTRVTLTGKVPEGVTGGSLAGGAMAVPLVIGTDGAVEVSFTAEPGSSGMRTLTLDHVTGKKLDGWKAMVTVKADTPPVVELLVPKAGELRVNRDDILPIEFQANDDIRLESVSYELKIDGAPEVAWPLDHEVAPGRALIDRDRLNLSKLASAYPKMREVRLRVLAKDGLPPELGGPGVGRSAELVLHIEDHQPSVAGQQAKNDHEEARKELDQAERELREARDKIAHAEGQLENEAIREDTQQRLAEADQQLESAAERLEQVAEDAPVVAELAQKGAEEMEAARAAAAKAPLQDNPQERRKMAATSREQADMAIRTVGEIRRMMEEDRRAAEKQAQLHDLALKERGLAREAEELAKTPDVPQPEDLQRRQDEVARQVAEQLKDNPQAQAEHAALQAEALADQARDAAAHQEELEKQAQAAPAKSADAPLPQGADEAAAIASEAKALSEKPATPEAADQAAAQAATAAEAAKAAAEAAAKGQQETAAAEHEKAAENLEAAANALQDAAKQPGQEPAVAAQTAALAERAADAAAQQEALQAQAEAAAEANAMAADQQQASVEAAAVADAAAKLGENPAAARPARPAAQQAQQAAKAAEQAAQAGKQGEPAAAAPQHGAAAEALAAAAEAFDQAAADIRQAADKQLGRAPENPAAEPLAQAAQAAAQAAAAEEPAAAAEASSQAAEALDLAASQSTPGGTPPSGPPSAPQPPQPGSGPELGQGEPKAGMRDEPVGDVPAELVRLGVSAGDWEKIQASLRSDVGSSGAVVIPEDYRELVKAYFGRIAEGEKNP